MRAGWKQDLLDWLQQWNEPGTLGDVVPWVITGIVSLTSALIALILRKRQRSREQALQVSFWIEELPGARWVVRVRNSSKLPISDVMVLAGHDNNEDSSQIFTARNIGPERSIDFALRRNTQAPEQILVKVIFTDKTKRIWELTEESLTRRKEKLAKSFFSNLPLDERAVAHDHSDAFSADGERVALEGIQVTRFDLDERDGTSITVLFLPPGGSPSNFGSVVEVIRDDDTAQIFARAYLDLENHILKLTVSNLPADTREYAFPQEYGESDHHFMYFGKKNEVASDLMDLERVDHVQHLGGNNLPVDLGAYIAFDSTGHLLCIMIPRDRFVPGYLKY